MIKLTKEKRRELVRASMEKNISLYALAKKLNISSRILYTDAKNMNIPMHNKFTKESLIVLLKKLEKEVGHIPQKIEWIKCKFTPSETPMKEKFGNWDNFLKEAGYTTRREKIISKMAKVKKLYNNKMTLYDIAKELNTAPAVISKYVKKLNLPKRKHSKIKLTIQQAIEIIILYITHKGNQREIGEQYGVTSACVNSICCGRTWKGLFQETKEKYNLEIIKNNNNLSRVILRKNKKRLKN